MASCTCELELPFAEFQARIFKNAHLYYKKPDLK